MKRIGAIVILFLSLSGAYAQDNKWEAAVGMGFPDGVHVGLNREVSSKSAVGVSLGYFPLKYPILQITGEHKRHFSTSTKFADQPTWYFGQRLTYLYEDVSPTTWHYLFLTPSLGRHFYVSPRAGINLDAGPAVKVWQKVNRSRPCMECDEGPGEDNRFIILPAARLQLFYRF